MQSISDILEDLQVNWRDPRPVGDEPDDPNPQLLACLIRPVAMPSQRIPMPDSIHPPSEVQELWAACDGAELFRDVRYGQWGLRLLSQEEAADRSMRYSTEDFRAARGDLVIGEFIGDGELLVARSDKSSPDYGSIVVVDEIHKRVNWLVAAKELRTFLARYAMRMGRKFWVDEPVYIGGTFSG